ncbi:MAG: hypothetical protein R3F61_33760 [Myxococcota bacterium]
MSEATVEVLEGSLRANGPGVLASRLSLLAGLEVSAALADVRVPMLYVQAEHDWLVPSANLDAILAVRADVRVVRIAAPHLVLQAEPVAALAAIRAWFRGSGR